MDSVLEKQDCLINRAFNVTQFHTNTQERTHHWDTSLLYAALKTVSQN